MQVVLDAEAAQRGLRRVAGQIVERSHGLSDVVLIGIRRGGEPIADAIAHWLQELEGQAVPRGSVDITLYRDDAATALANPKIGPSKVPGSLQDKVVILCDDVVYTGRTVRAAIDALMDYGRPRRIELATLVERSGRELPIAADYSVIKLDLEAEDRVDVLDDALGLRALVHSTGTRSVVPSFI